MKKILTFRNIILFIYSLFEGIYGCLFILNPLVFSPASDQSTMVLTQMFGVAIVSIGFLSLLFISHKKHQLTNIGVRVLAVYNILMTVIMVHAYIQFHLTAAIFGGLVGIGIHSCFAIAFIYLSLKQFLYKNDTGA